MRKIICFFCLFVLTEYMNSQPATIFPRILSRPGDPLCEKQINVSDAKTSNCDLEPGCGFLYPVFVEDFDYRDDLPNKWRFDLGGKKSNYFTPGASIETWFGDAFYPDPLNGVAANHNIQLSGGTMKIICIPEKVGRTDYLSSPDTFNTTSGLIATLSQFRTGTFEARIKVPAAEKMWTAFWLLSNKAAYYSEIDIFEFHDEDLLPTDPCDTYDLHKMTLHGGQVGNECHRDDRYPLANHTDWHDYKLVWNETEIYIFVDNNFKGYGTKYSGNFSLPIFTPCKWSSISRFFDPSPTYKCSDVNSLPSNVLAPGSWGPQPSWWPTSCPNWWPSCPLPPWPPPIPPPPITITNKIMEDPWFPDKNSNMHLIINNSINNKFGSHDFSTFTQTQRTMEIDWVHVYQPFCCGVNKTVCDIFDMNNQTYNSDILTGKILNVGKPDFSCHFIHYKPGTYPVVGDSFREVPILLLATDEISINAEAEFRGDQYVEARIVDDCGFSNRVLNNSESEQLEDFYAQQEKKQDSILNSQQILANEERDKYLREYLDNYTLSYSRDVSVSPIPSSDIVNIQCSEGTFNQIVSMVIVDVNGKEYYITKDYRINIKDFSPGMYFLRLEFIDGEIVNKKIVKM